MRDEAGVFGIVDPQAKGFQALVEAIASERKHAVIAQGQQVDFACAGVFSRKADQLPAQGIQDAKEISR